MDTFYETPFPMDRIPEPIFPSTVVSAAAYPTIQAAIDACVEAGGGTVEIPAGEWHTGPLRLGSRIRLFVQRGAEVIFSDDPADYLPVVFTRWEGSECRNYSPLIYALEASDIAICGKGTLVGSAISGGARNIYAYDCMITGTMQGLRLKSMRGRGGIVENIWFHHIHIGTVSHEAIQVNMFYEFSTVMPKSRVPSCFRNLHFSDVRCDSARVGIAIKGLPEKNLQNITLRDIEGNAQQAMLCTDVSGLTMERVTLNPPA